MLTRSGVRGASKDYRGLYEEHWGFSEKGLWD
jgi:hypothetical protein